MQNAAKSLDELFCEEEKASMARMEFQDAVDGGCLVEYTKEFVFGSYIYHVKTFKSNNKQKVLVVRTKNEENPIWSHGVLVQKLTAEGFKPGVVANPSLIFSEEYFAIDHLRLMNLET